MLRLYYPEEYRKFNKTIDFPVEGMVLQVDDTATSKLCMECMYTNFTKYIYDTMI